MSERLYNVFRDGNDGISFKNFAIFGWNICATDRESLPVFAFQVYDQQGAGFLCERPFPPPTHTTSQHQQHECGQGTIVLPSCPLVPCCSCVLSRWRWRMLQVCPT